MSNVRLVRCPKCDKVLPEPAGVPVYKCGGCGAVLRAKKKSSASDELFDGSVEKLVNFRGDFDKEGSLSEEGSLDMASRFPARSVIEDGNGIRLPMRERDLTEFNGGLSKSPMRDRFLDDLGRTPGGSRNASRSPVSERVGSNNFDFDGAGGAVLRSRNVSRSPMRGRGGTPVSVRTRGVTRSPMREMVRVSDINAVAETPAKSMVGETTESPLRGGLGPEVERDLEEERERVGKMTPKASFNTWLSEEKNDAQPVDNYPGRRQRRMWRDGVEDRSDQFSEERDSVYSDEHGMTSEGLFDDRFHEFGNRKEKVYRDERLRGEYAGGYARPRVIGDQRISEGNGFRSSYGTSRVAIEKERYLASPSVVDGYSNYRPDPIHGYGGLGGPRHNFESSRGPPNAQDLQLEHAELLRKYKELKDQLNGLDGSGVSSPGFQVRPDDWSEDGSLRFERGSVQQFPFDRNVPRPSAFSRVPGPGHNMADPHQFYDDPLAGQWRRAHPNHRHLSDYPMSRRVQGQSLDFDQDHLESIAKYPHVHHPLCTCSLCYTSDWRARDVQSSLATRRLGNVAPNSTSGHSMNLDRHGPRAYDPRMAHTAPRQKQPQHRHLVRAELPSLSKRLCRPVSGGSPFVICNKCFELLKLPRKFISKHRDQHQLQCGACSAIMSFDLQTMSVDQLPSEKKPDPASTASGFSEVMNESGPKQRRDSFAASSTNVGSYDFDATGYTFQSMDSEDDKASKGQKFSSNLAEMSRASGSPSHSSKDERSSDSASVRSSQPNSSEMQVKIRPPPGSPLRENLDYSTPSHISQARASASYTGDDKQVLEKNTFLEGLPEVDATDTEVLSSHISQARASASYTGDDKQVLEKNTFLEGLPEVDATETEVLSNDVPVTSLSQDSWDVPRESPVTSLSQDSWDVPRESPVTGKDAQSPIAAFFKGLSRSGRRSPGKAEVYVNGQAISHRLVKKAEKLSGPIQPGEYWYDPKAGFWGVMGHCCLGIIPPFIQEFSFPIPENCSRGDTSVYVNGRELHKTDLDLLAGRGLPIISNKKYVIDITGEVRDENTRNFVANLGRLAPSVERNKCGFGMQVPEQLDD